jgi:hypothetical protein
MGPWTHGGFQTTKQGELTYPENSKDNFSWDMFVEMLDQYILDASDDFENHPNVSYYVMGDVTDSNAPGNMWRYSDYWPVEYHEDEWYFHHDGLLSKEIPDDDPLTYFYNPNNPVPSVGGQNLILPRGPYDQKSVENRDDVLIFTSDILTEPYEATGPIKARLYVSSDCPDTDFTVKLTDVYPDGRSMLITEGILKMRFRNGFDHWDFMEPGVIYEIEVDVWSTSYIWNTGHQIRIAVSSSNYPRFLNNPNTADPIYQNTDTYIAENTVYLDYMHPSCIILPHVEENYQPGKPTIKGPTSGRVDMEYTFCINVTDPNGDDIYAIWHWGDGTNTGWLGPYPSGQEICVTHSWEKPGTYTISVKLKDEFGLVSPEATIKIVITEKSRAFNIPFLNFIQQYQYIFPILQTLLQRFVI